MSARKHIARSWTRVWPPRISLSASQRAASDPCFRDMVLLAAERAMALAVAEA
jgi:hypothetical protein